MTFKDNMLDSFDIVTHIVSYPALSVTITSLNTRYSHSLDIILNAILTSIDFSAGLNIRKRYFDTYLILNIFYGNDLKFTNKTKYVMFNSRLNIYKYVQLPRYKKVSVRII